MHCGILKPDSAGFICWGFEISAFISNTAEVNGIVFALQRELKSDIVKLAWQIIKHVKYSLHLVTAFSQENEPQKTAHSDS